MTSTCSTTFLSSSLFKQIMDTSSEPKKTALRGRSKAALDEENERGSPRIRLIRVANIQQGRCVASIASSTTAIHTYFVCSLVPFYCLGLRHVSLFCTSFDVGLLLLMREYNYKMNPNPKPFPLAYRKNNIKIEAKCGFIKIRRKQQRPYAPPRRRSTRWRVDSFWML